MAKRLHVVFVEWVDSCHYGEPGWVPAEHCTKFAGDPPMTCVTVGFLIGRNKKSITLCGALGGSSRAGLEKIPRSAILTYKKLTSVERS